MPGWLTCPLALDPCVYYLGVGAPAKIIVNSCAFWKRFCLALFLKLTEKMYC